MAKKLNIQLTNGTRFSESAKQLAKALSVELGYKVFRTQKSSTKRAHLKYGQGADKLTQYHWFADNNIPALEYTTDVDEATQWVDTGAVVIGRQMLNSSCGKGITILDGSSPDGVLGALFLNTPVFTLYKKKKREFRVHVFKDKIVRVTEKKLRKDWNGPRESKIRNLANGFVYCSCDTEPDNIRNLAIAASGVVQSDFKGVDIGYNEKLHELFVIEVNSAPGMQGTTLSSYTNAIKEYVQV